MKIPLPVLASALGLAPMPCVAQPVEEVRPGSPDAPGLPEDLFRLTPNTWSVARQLWKGDDPCTADQCEAGYNSGDMVVSVERGKRYLRIVAGFRGCESVAWNEYKIGDKPSKRDTKTIGKRIRKTVGTSAKYCRVEAPGIATLDSHLLYPAAAPPAPQPQADQ